MSNNKEIVVKDNIEILEYCTAVREIAGKFFNDGEYTPYFGRINAVLVFAKYFVDEKSFEELFPESTDENPVDVSELIKNEEFLKAYNDAYENNPDGSFRLNFFNAYKDAKDIVETKNTTIAGAVEYIKESVLKISDKINSAFTEEEINNLLKISENVAKGNLSAESIVEAYGNSKRFKEVIEENKKD